jgi:hypothetical protein
MSVIDLCVDVGRMYKCVGGEGRVYGNVCCNVNCLRNRGGLPSIFYAHNNKSVMSAGEGGRDLQQLR